MKTWLTKYRDYFLIALVFLISEIIVNPLGEFPLNDDWAFSKSVVLLNTENKIDIGNWGSMTLVSQIVWGTLFVKLFGFSFFTLRFSTMISFLLAMFIFFFIIKKITGNRLIAITGSFLLMFYPVHYSLASTFMTDVNFNAWLLLGFYFSFRFFEEPKFAYLFLVFIMSLIVIFLRQYGLALPLSFTAGSLFMVKNKWKWIVFSLFMVVLSAGAFFWFDKYLKSTLPPYSGYMVFNHKDYFSVEFLNYLVYNLSLRITSMLYNPMVYCSPFLLLFVIDIVRKTNRIALAILLILNALLIFGVFIEVPFPTGNIFWNMSLGVESTTDVLFYTPPGEEHTYSMAFAKAVPVISAILAFIFTSTISLLLLGLFKKEDKVAVNYTRRAFFVTLTAFFLCYMLLLLATKSYFDRYMIPIITVTILLTAFAVGQTRPRLSIALPALLLFAYVSVAGTRDYFVVNRTKWALVEHLKKDKNIPFEKINGGFEVNCWNEGRISWWAAFNAYDEFQYAIGYRQPQDFEPYTYSAFNRWFPFKKDSLGVFVRKNILHGDTLKPKH